ncbi:MAG: translation initiation factor IF-2 subunit gamma [Nanoarchaeota archaeon]
MVGHVDNGKTTLTKTLSGKWTDTHSEEIKRGITIRLGYANVSFWTCIDAAGTTTYVASEKKPEGFSSAQFLRKVSLIDAPGHESLMATMLSGAAIIDGALLLVAANEPCPQPQTKEHLMALELLGIKKIVIVQNKIDLVTEEQALQNYEQIQSFVKGTIAEHAPIIPLSAQHNVNIDILIQAIQDVITTPQRDTKQQPLMFVARSFDVNKPGTPIEQLKGGVLGGALKQGVLSVGDEIEIRPGHGLEKEGKRFWEPIVTTIKGLETGGQMVETAAPGGSIGLLTSLDPFYVKSDSLTGNIVGKQGQLPPVWYELKLKPELLQRVVGTKEDVKVDTIKKMEPLMLNVNASATVGVVTDMKKNIIQVRLKIPVCCYKEDRITISRMIGNRWRLIGIGTIEG